MSIAEKQNSVANREEARTLLKGTDDSGKDKLRTCELYWITSGSSKRERGAVRGSNCITSLVGTFEKDLYHMPKTKRLNDTDSGHSDCFLQMAWVPFAQCKQVTREDKSKILAGSTIRRMNIDFSSLATPAQQAKWIVKKTKRCKRVRGLLPLTWHQSHTKNWMETFNAFKVNRVVVYRDFAGRAAGAACDLQLQSCFSISLNPLHQKYLNSCLEEHHVIVSMMDPKHRAFQGKDAQTALMKFFAPKASPADAKKNVKDDEVSESSCDSDDGGVSQDSDHD